MMNYYIIFLIVFVNLEEWQRMFANCNVITAELCGPHSLITLEPTGAASSVTIHLNPRDHRRMCKLNITAPSSYLVNLQWHEENKELLDNHSTSYSPCILNIFLPGSKRTAVWKGDPCGRESPNEVDLLTPQFNLIWSPPRFSFHTRGRKLVITAVAQRDTCKIPGMHTCMRIGWEPVLCVSEQLVCDGNPNCPKGAPTSDEDEVLCKSHLLGQSSWQQLAEEVIRKLPSGIINNSWLQNKRKDNDITTELPQMPFINWKDLKKYEVITTTEPNHNHHHDGGDSVSAALAHYGPWGYLMLGMLICGTVLMFCGLWECCFRKPKPQIDLQSSQQPTTVLIINHQQDDLGTHQPPNYEDLDQPPSYVSLFPNFKMEMLEINSSVSNDEEQISAGDGGGGGGSRNSLASVPNTSNDNYDDVDNDSDDDSDNNNGNNAVENNVDSRVNSANSRGNSDEQRRRGSPTVCIVTTNF